MRRKALIFTFTLMVSLALAAIVTLATTDVAIAQGGSIYQATLAELGGGGELGVERYTARTAALRKMKPAYDKYDQALAAAPRLKVVA